MTTGTSNWTDVSNPQVWSKISCLSYYVLIFIVKWLIFVYILKQGHYYGYCKWYLAETVCHLPVLFGLVTSIIDRY